MKLLEGRVALQTLVQLVWTLSALFVNRNKVELANGNVLLACDGEIMNRELQSDKKNLQHVYEFCWAVISLSAPE